MGHTGKSSALQCPRLFLTGSLDRPVGERPIPELCLSGKPCLYWHATGGRARGGTGFREANGYRGGAGVTRGCPLCPRDSPCGRDGGSVSLPEAVGVTERRDDP